MKILDSKFVRGFIKMANDGYLQGWHERNGGNLSYRLKPEEVEMIRPRLNAERRMETYWNRSTGTGRGVFPGNGKR